jgi:short-subunit dehydrogenase
MKARSNKLPTPRPGSIALVTGASSGIGEQFARHLSARGYQLALVARRTERLEALATELGGDDRAIVIGADLALEPDRDKLAATLEPLGVTVDVLVNNAGLGVYQAFAKAGRARELQQVRVDVEAVIDLMARYLPGMVERGRGAIINMASTAAFQPLPYNAGYSAAKSYVLLLSEAVNEEVKDSGVTVTAVCPGPVPTEFEAHLEGHGGELIGKLPKVLWVSAERVARDALAAADAGRRTVIPGGAHVKAAFAPNRLAPASLTLRVTKQLMGT